MLVAFLVAFASNVWVAFRPLFRRGYTPPLRERRPLDYIDYKGYPVVSSKGYYKDYYTHHHLILYAISVCLNLNIVKAEDLFWKAQ